MTNEIASQNIQSDKFTATDLAYKALISNYSHSATLTSVPSIDISTTENTISQAQAGKSLALFIAITVIITLALLVWFVLKRRRSLPVTSQASQSV